MKVTGAPDFGKKISALDLVSLSPTIAAMLQFFQSNELQTILGNTAYNIRLLGNNVYVADVGPLQVYFTSGSDEDGEYIVLLDVSSSQQSGAPASGRGSFFAVKDPRVNQTLNPVYNHTINPIYNHAIKPIYNHTINPIYNHTINPIYNHTINPIYNRAFGGPYVYSSALDQEGYVVRANDNVDLHFDRRASFSGIAVRPTEDYAVLFDKANHWVGYLVHAHEVFLRFDKQNNWTGLVF